MRLRFLQTVPSLEPEYPFMAGQVITTPKLTPEMHRWVQAGWAEVMRGEQPELATVAPGERAVTRRGRPRTHGMALGARHRTRAGTADAR